MGVVALWRFPVKEMLGERLDAMLVGVDGPDGDRRWVVADAATGERIASKRGPTDARLRACRAALTPDGEPRVTLPDGTTAEGEEAAARLLSALLGRTVRLERGHHRDFAPVHLVTTATLAHLDADARRLRPNLVLADPAGAPYGEDALLGRALTGGAALQVDLPTPRCVVPTRASEELAARPGLLRTIAREHRLSLGPRLGRPACAGAYATVRAPGRLAVGDRLAVGPPTAADPQAAAEAAVRRFGLA